jgi:hypothetical protein
MNPRYPVIATRAGYRCEYCHAPQVISNSHFEVEHIHPVSRGGGEHDDNLALACPSCNVFKAAALSAVDPASGELVVLFHPRLHVWVEHFEVIECARLPSASSCSSLRMQAAEPAPADAWLAQTKIAPPLQVPTTLEAWQTQRVEIRAKLNELLGDLPPRPPVSAFQIITREDKGTYTLGDDPVRQRRGRDREGLLFVPKKATAQSKAPAILYCHWHGGQYDIGKQELLQHERDAGGSRSGAGGGRLCRAGH